MVILYDEKDAFLLDFIQRFIANNQSQIILIYLQDTVGANVKERARLIKQNAPNHLSDYVATELSANYFKGIELMMTSYNMDNTDTQSK